MHVLVHVVASACIRDPEGGTYVHVHVCTKVSSLVKKVLDGVGRYVDTR